MRLATRSELCVLKALGGRNFHRRTIEAEVLVIDERDNLESALAEENRNCNCWPRRMQRLGENRRWRFVGRASHVPF
jgi:hypothetical protein